MKSQRGYNCLGITILIWALGSMAAYCAQNPTSVTEITPNLLVFGTDNGNVLASVGADGALIVGTPSAASTAQISSVLAGRTKSPVRYVVIAPQDLAHSQGDAGWGRRGAFVAMQENALQRLGGHAMGPPVNCRLGWCNSELTAHAFPSLKFYLSTSMEMPFISSISRPATVTQTRSCISTLLTRFTLARYSLVTDIRWLTRRKAATWTAWSKRSAHGQATLSVLFPPEEA
jgi:hypothetical protein